MSDTSQAVEALGYRQELKRSLGLRDLLIYGLVFIGPTAPFAVFGIVFNASAGMVPLTYLVGVAAMIFTALSYAKMAHVVPLAGSVYAYTTHSMGGVAGFFAGWAILLDYLLIPTLANVVCAIAIHAIYPAIPQAACVIVLLAFATIVNYLGIESTARANIALVILQLVILLLFLGAAALAVANGVDGAHLSTEPLYNPATFSPGLVLGALSLGVLSFLGFDGISTLSEEARGGPNAVAKATIISLCIAGVLFMIQTYAASLFTLGRAAFPNEAAGAALYGIAGDIGGEWLRWTVAILGVTLGAVAGSLAGQAATARLIYGMARDGRLPRALAHIHPVRQVPERAVFLVAGINLVLSLFFVSKLELLTSMVCFGALVGFTFVNLSVIAHHVRTSGASSYRHWILPGFGAVISLFVLWNTSDTAKIAGLVWLAVGEVYFIELRLAGRAAIPTSPEASAP